MQYKNIHKAIFLERLHRFGALVDINGKVEYVHVKNTGRCKELFIPGVRLFLEKSDNPGRKTKYSIISVYKGEMLINIDSQVPNEVVFDAVSNEVAEGLPKVSFIKREVVYGNSRFDIYYETETGGRGFIEVKGVTLDLNGTAMFPDAPTVRGRKHLLELADAKTKGYEAHVVFLIQYKPAREFKPNTLMDPAFSKALSDAFKAGVGIHAYDCSVSEDTINIGKPVKINISQS
ncbi:MAG: DNA/RNA nuclease SfsA [Clostridiales bacterium]|nr:DNA/RNA nuclease SfsA [Clostridiales bacterium]